MPNITFLNPDGSRQTFDIAEGVSVMQGAVANSVGGIVGECGGNAMCATCHVYVDGSQVASFRPMSANEDALLDGTASDRKRSSPLARQILVAEAGGGMVVELPERQI